MPKSPKTLTSQKHISDYLEFCLENARIDFENIAIEKIEQFSAVLTRLLTLENEKFDLIIGAGTSGLVFAKFAEITYNHLGIKLPHSLVLPVCEDRIASSKAHQKILTEISKKELKSISRIRNVLYVDSEINSPTSAYWSIRSTLKVFGLDKANLTIIADDKGFEWHYKDEIAVRFFSTYSNFPNNLTHVYSNLMSESEYKTLSKIIGTKMERNELWALLLSQNILVCSPKKAFFDDRLYKHIHEEFPEVEHIKNHLIKIATKHLKSGSDKYKVGKISFPF